MKTEQEKASLALIFGIPITENINTIGNEIFFRKYFTILPFEGDEVYAGYCGICLDPDFKGINIEADLPTDGSYPPSIYYYLYPEGMAKPTLDPTKEAMVKRMVYDLPPDEISLSEQQRAVEPFPMKIDFYIIPYYPRK